VRQIEWPFGSMFNGEACAGASDEGIQPVLIKRKRGFRPVRRAPLSGKSVMFEPARLSEALRVSSTAAGFPFAPKNQSSSRRACEQR